MSFVHFLKRIIYKHHTDGDTYIQWLKKNGTVIGDNVTIYNARNTCIDETSLEYITIGKNTQITAGVTILAHDYSYSVLGNVFWELPRVQRETVIGENVFIGMNSTILGGAVVGDNTIIGAGSVVHGILESNAVYAGNPAKKICTLEEYLIKSRARFEESAKIYYKNKQRKQSDITSNDMIIYQALFSDNSIVKNYIKTHRFCGLDNDNVNSIDMSGYRKYESFEDMIKSWKETAK